MRRQHSRQHFRLPGVPVDRCIQLLCRVKGGRARQAFRASRGNQVCRPHFRQPQTRAALPHQPAMHRPPAAPPSSSRQPWAQCPPGRAAGSCTPQPRKRRARGRRRSVAGRSGGRICRGWGGVRLLGTQHAKQSRRFPSNPRSTRCQCEGVPCSTVQRQGAAPLRFAELLPAAVQPAQAVAGGEPSCVSRHGPAASQQASRPASRGSVPGERLSASLAAGWPVGRLTGRSSIPEVANHTVCKPAPPGPAHRRMGPVSTMLLAPHSMPACRPLSSRFRARARGPRSSRACGWVWREGADQLRQRR